MEFRGKNWFFNLFTLGLMFPINVAILPVYFVLRQMNEMGINMIDSLLGCHSGADRIPDIRQHPDPARFLHRHPG